MGLAKASLAGQQRDAQGTALNPAQQLDPEPLLQLGEIHLWKIHHETGGE